MQDYLLPKFRAVQGRVLEFDHLCNDLQTCSAGFTESFKHCSWHEKASSRNAFEILQIVSNKTIGYRIQVHILNDNASLIFVQKMKNMTMQWT